MDAIDAELSITATETCEEIHRLLSPFQSQQIQTVHSLDLGPLALQLREMQKCLEDAVMAFPRPLVSGRLDEPGPIAASLVALVSELSRTSLLLHGLARTTDDRMAAALRCQVTNVGHAADAVVGAMTPQNFAGIRAFVDDEWLGNVLITRPAT